MFLKNRNVNPAGGVSNTSPNVGQYGWTKTESSYYNQLLQYVESARKYAESANTDANYIKGRLEEIDKALKYFEELYTKIYPLANRIDSMYQRVLEIRAEVDSNHKNIITLEQAVRDMYETIEVYYNDIVVRSDKVGEEAIEVRLLKTATETLRNECQDLVNDLRSGQVYRGTWNPKTGAYPDNGGTNSTWDVILDDGVTDQSFDGKTWRNGDRLVYVQASGAYQRIATGSGVTSVNGAVGAVTVTTAMINAVPTSDVGSGANWNNIINKIPKVSSAGVLEIGKYIDLHETNSTVDYDVRIAASNTTGEAGKGNLHITGSQLLIGGNRVFTEGFLPSADQVGAVTSAQLQNAITEMKNALFPIGYVYVSFGTANPSTLGYPGTWVQLDADSSLSSSASPSTTVTGTNTPSVPVPQHTHSFSGSADNGGAHTHSGTTEGAGAHNHTTTINAGRDSGTSATHMSRGNTSSTTTYTWTSSTAGDHTHNITINEGGSHTHSVSGTIGNTGVSGATLDVRGKRYTVTMWRRSA